MPTLHILTEGLTHSTFELHEGVTVIGRDDDCAIHIPDASMSNEHGQFTVTGGQVVYRDLGSTNGSFINEEQVTADVVLPEGAEFRLASVVMVIGNGVDIGAKSKRTTAVIQVAPTGIKPEELTAEAEEVESPFKKKGGIGGRMFTIFIAILILAIIGIVISSLTNLFG